MKFNSTTLLFLVLFCIITCKNEHFDYRDPNVKLYISSLKAKQEFNNIDNLQTLPNFSHSNLEALLEFAKDTSPIDFFPTHPLSIDELKPKILNECVFWMIDGIRFDNRYPSLNPIIIDTISNKRISRTELITIGEKYIDWYKRYKNDPSITIERENLFEKTPYQWR